jgi:hypothetical protein
VNYIRQRSDNQIDATVEADDAFLYGLRNAPRDITIFMAQENSAETQRIESRLRQSGFTRIVRLDKNFGGTGHFDDKMTDLRMRVFTWYRSRGIMNPGFADYLIVLWPHSSAVQQLSRALVRANIRFAMLGTSAMSRSSYHQNAAQHALSASPNMVHLYTVGNPRLVWFLHRVPDQWLVHQPFNNAWGGGVAAGAVAAAAAGGEGGGAGGGGAGGEGGGAVQGDDEEVDEEEEDD